MNSIISVQLDRPRRLIFDMNAMAAIESQNGGQPTLGPRAPEFWTRPSGVLRIRLLLWAALLREDPSLTIDRVGDLLTRENINQAEAKLIEALQVFFPEMAEAPPENPTPGQATSGSGSGPSPDTTSV